MKKKLFAQIKALADKHSIELNWNKLIFSDEEGHRRCLESLKTVIKARELDKQIQ